MRLYSPVENRVFGLDLMRAVAILAVLLAHSQYLLERVEIGPVPLFDGVDTFFVLSGFLIGGILLKTLQTDGLTVRSILSFWRRRWLRTLPNYFLFLGINLAVAAVIFPYAFNAFDASFLTFSQNLFPFAANHAFFPEAWSLSVEEWFYLLTPLLLGASAFVLRLRSVAVAAAVTAVLLVTAATWGRAAMFHASTITTFMSHDENIRKVVIFRLDALAFGLLASVMRQTAPALWRRGRFWSMAIGLLLVVGGVAWEQHIWATTLTWSYSTWYPTVLSVGFACLLPVLDGWRTATGRAAAFITFTSLISYSLYLVHYSLLVLPLQTYLASVRGATAVALFVVFWIVTYAGATMNYFLFESRVLSYRDRGPTRPHRVAGVHDSAS